MWEKSCTFRVFSHAGIVPTGVPQNMAAIDSTLDVSRAGMFDTFNESQYLNMSAMSVTFDVSYCGMFRRLLHPENISDISSTFDVSSMGGMVSDEQLLNIPFVRVALCVSTAGKVDTPVQLAKNPIKS